MAITRVTKRQLNTFTAKGDLLSNDGTSNTIVAVGTDGQHLLADSTATSGLRWNPAVGGFKNKVINGTMRYWQRGTSFASIASNTWTSDRFIYKKDTTSGVSTIARDTDVPASTTGGNFPFSLKVSVTTADASVAAGDVAWMGQNIEGYNFLPLKGQAMTLSFWVRAFVTGTYCVAFQNAANNRSYIATYTINASDTWEQKKITLTHDITGTWDYTTGVGLSLQWMLMAGTTYQSTAGTWQGSNVKATSAQTNLYASTSNTWYLTGVQLELGSTASAFESRLDSEELLLCYRYYEKSYEESVVPGTASITGITFNWFSGALLGSVGGNVAPPGALGFKVPKRATPTMVFYDFDGTANACRVYPVDAKRIGITAVANIQTTGFFQFLTFNNTGTQAIIAGSQLNASWTADAELP